MEVSSPQRTADTDGSRVNEEKSNGVRVLSAGSYKGNILGTRKEEYICENSI